MSFDPSEPRAFDPAAASSSSSSSRKLGGGPPGGKLDRPGFGASRVVMGVLAFVAMLIAFSIVLSVVAGPSGLDSPAGTVAVLVAQSIAFVIAAVTLARPILDDGRGASIRATLRELGLRRSEGPIASTVVFAVVTYIGASILIAVTLAPEQEDVTRALGVEASTAAAIAAGIMIVLVAPVVEELFFRGFLFGGLRRDLPFWAAGVIANAVFGLAHLTGSTNFAVVGQLFIFGLVLSWLYERTNSLRPCIALHAVNNAFAFAALLAT